MSDTFGAVYVQGQQFGSTFGASNQAIGQFAIPCSGTIGTSGAVVANGAWTAFPVPVPNGVPFAAGVVIIPDGVAGAPYLLRFNTSDDGIELSATTVSVQSFDSTHIPNDIYLTMATAGYATIVVQFF